MINYLNLYNCSVSFMLPEPVLFLLLPSNKFPMTTTALTHNWNYNAIFFSFLKEMVNIKIRYFYKKSIIPNHTTLCYYELTNLLEQI